MHHCILSVICKTYSCTHVCVCVSLSVVSFCDPMGCSLPGSSVLGILQARILEWVAIPFSRGSSRSRDQTQVSCIAGGFFTNWAIREAHTLIRKRLISIQHMDTRNICHSHLGSMKFSIKTLGVCLWICTFLGRCVCVCVCIYIYIYIYIYVYSITAKVF